jgi:hypothetical protein
MVLCGRYDPLEQPPPSGLHGWPFRNFFGTDGTCDVDDGEAVIIGTVGPSGACRMRPGRPAAPFTVHIQGAIEQTEAGHAAADQVRMARDVAAMFDELKALADRHAALHADQARLQAELEQARAELEQAQRPWWRRLFGR